MVFEPELFSEFVQKIYKFWCWTNAQNLYQGQHALHGMHIGNHSTWLQFPAKGNGPAEVMAG